MSDIPTGFNALSGASIAGTERGYWNGGTQALNSDVYSNEPDNGSEKTLSVFYLPVPAKSQNLTFSITVKDASGKVLTQSVKLEVENVPLVGNKLTTIKGNLLSKNATFNVTIDDEFEDDETIIEYGKEASTVDALKAAMTGKNETITYTGKVTKANGFELDFTDVANTVYPEGNNASLTLAFASIEDGAVLTFKGTNAPKTLCIKTNTKCSLRINLPKTDINYDGSAYKYIVTNAGCKTYKTGVIYEAMFQTPKAGGFYSSDDAFHLFDINEDFSLPEDLVCKAAFLHEGTCATLLESLKKSNSAWDFVGDTNN